jgi:hypothetical protein
MVDTHQLRVFHCVTIAHLDSTVTKTVVRSLLKSAPLVATALKRLLILFSAKRVPTLNLTCWVSKIRISVLIAQAAITVTMVPSTVQINAMLAITATRVHMSLTRMVLSAPPVTTVQREPSFLSLALTVSTRKKVLNQKMIAQSAKPDSTVFVTSHQQLCLYALSVITVLKESTNLYLALRVPTIPTLSLRPLIDA